MVIATAGSTIVFQIPMRGNEVCVALPPLLVALVSNPHEG